MKFSNQRAIFLSENGEIKKTLTYDDVARHHNLITDFIRQFFKERHLCVGLKMSHNIYIPSLVLSLQELEHAFIFLPDSDSETVKVLGIACVLSFEPLQNWTSKLNLGDDELFLGRDVNIPCKNYENIYYIIKTSGTTGQNKFVKVTKACIESNIASLTKMFAVNQDSVIYFGTPLTFDPSMIELLLALHNGASLLITTQKIRLSPALLHNTLFHPQNGINVLQIVPSLFLRWTRQQICSILQNPGLRILAFGGEQFPESILQYYKHDNLRIFNLYGITELSCWASVYETNPNDSEIPLGNALNDTVIEIRDDSGGAVIEGEGEIYIGSESRICLIDQEISNPIFRATGDIGVIKNGSIYYKGRKNDVIKRLGHKIHLSQIEKIVKTETRLSNKCVWSEVQSKLLLFLISDQYDNHMRDKVIDKIRVKLLHSLPKHYFPDFIHMLQKCPVTVNGKMDTKVLEDIYLKRDKANNRNCVEAFKLLICEYFGLGHYQLKDVGGNTFFDLGGSSVLAVQLLSEFQNEIDAEYPPELVAGLFERDLNSCFDLLQNAQINRKRKLQNVLPTNAPDKKIKKEVELEIEWTYNMHACVDSSPLVFENGDKIFVAVGSFSHIFAIVNGLTGQEVSKFVLPDVVEASPCLSQCSNYLYVGCFDGKMYSFDYINATIKWTYSTGDRIKCKPVVCRNAKSIVFGSYDQHIHCINTQDGTGVWKTSVSESVISTPCVKSENIFATTISGTCLCLSETNGDILWRWKSGSPIFGDHCIYQNSVIIPTVQGKILSLTTHGDKMWEFECGGDLYSSLLLYKDLVIFGCHNRNLYFLRVNGESVKTVNLEKKISRGPSLGVVKGKTCVIVASDDGSVFVVDFEGCVIGEICLPAQVFSTAAVFGGCIYIGCRDNSLCCIKIV